MGMWIIYTININLNPQYGNLDVNYVAIYGRSNVCTLTVPSAPHEYKQPSGSTIMSMTPPSGRNRRVLEWRPAIDVNSDTVKRSHTFRWEEEIKMDIYFQKFPDPF